MKKRSQNIAVVGLGYVGLPLALLADKKGYGVFGIDNNIEKVRIINKKESPFEDLAIAKAIKRSSLKATSNFGAIKDVSVIVICVPTPVYENRMPNLEPVENACANIAPHLKKGQLVILESTVNPGVSEGVVLPILEKGSGLKCGKDFSLAHCPERINPGDKRWNVSNIPRVVGSFDKNGLRKAVNFYTSIVSAKIKQMGSLKEAESVKVVENSFRDVNIAFVNELAMSFSTLGIDVVNVIEGAATKPFSFMSHFPGAGVGGHCIPVDPYYLIEYAKDNGFNHDFLKLARKINDKMPKFTVEKVLAALKEKNIQPKAARITVLGVSYKPEIDDYRESPSFEIIEELKKAGAEVVVFDPFVASKSDVTTLDKALKGADVVIVATAHKVFKKITPRTLLKYGIAIIVDGRNCLPKEKFLQSGIIYKGIGR